MGKISKNLVKILHSYVRFSTKNLAKIRQDPDSKYMQVLIMMVMQDHM